jgi:hypothetical protein
VSSGNSLICQSYSTLYTIATEEYETDLIRRLRSGEYSVLLPETIEQFSAMSEVLMETKTYVPQAFVNGYFKSRLRLLKVQKNSNLILCQYLRLKSFFI